MSTADWIVLIVTLAVIISYGVYKSRGLHGSKTYLLADKQMPWYVVLLGIMATQASAITFLSAPGQAYTDGMRFVQYYFGLPIAMVVISVCFIPIFQKLNVYTAYQYLEERFDRKTRLLTAVLFLLSRALSTGISIYAPSIILSSIMGWNIYLTNIITGGLLIIYTWSGGAKAIAHTQKLQFLIILSSMAVAGVLVVMKLPQGISFSDALYVAGKSGKLNVITTSFDWKDKYNLWSGIFGGFFLALSYFGTDQSQVGRYLTAKGLRESRLGLLLNGMVKVPMQFSILLIGALLFSFYSFYHAPVHFNEAALEDISRKQPVVMQQLNHQYQTEWKNYEKATMQLLQARHSGSEAALEQFRDEQQKLQSIKDSVRRLMLASNIGHDENDTNYIFLYFVKHTLPVGLVGLLFAVIFLASWGSISAALNALASSSLMDVQLLAHKQPRSEAQQLRLGRLHTLIWGLFCIAVAMFATRLGSLIEAVNVLGSLFYGAILGIFLTAFFIKKAKGTGVFVSALIAELVVIVFYNLEVVSFLWYNVIGALVVVGLSWIGTVLRQKS